jgi:hypothetical protein
MGWSVLRSEFWQAQEDGWVSGFGFGVGDVVWSLLLLLLWARVILLQSDDNWNSFLSREALGGD